MKEIVKRYKVEFNVPQYNAEYSFTLTKSASFSYGNGTCVVFKKNGKVDSVLDTRYDRDVTKDFGAWCMSFLETAFDRSYEPKITEITEA